MKRTEKGVQKPNLTNPDELPQLIPGFSAPSHTIVMDAPSISDAIVFLPAQDLRATEEFYRERLGLSLVADQGVCLIFKVTEAAYFGFCTHIQPLPNPESIILTIVADDPNAWHSHCADMGIETDGAPRLNDKYGIYHFYATDPNGYRVEFQRFVDPSWRKPLA